MEAAETTGGGTRTSENTVPGLLHDDCAAVVPIALASRSSAALISNHKGCSGVARRRPSSPIDSGRAGVMVRSLDED